MGIVTMQRFFGSGLGRSFSEDGLDSDEPVNVDESMLDADVGPSEPDYTFEGYSVEFIDKVELMPVVVSSGYSNG